MFLYVCKEAACGCHLKVQTRAFPTSFALCRRHLSSPLWRSRKKLKPQARIRFLRDLDLALFFHRFFSTLGELDSSIKRMFDLHMLMFGRSNQTEHVTLVV
jgi:hypothetical protein